MQYYFYRKINTSPGLACSGTCRKVNVSEFSHMIEVISVTTTGDCFVASERLVKTELPKIVKKEVPGQWLDISNCSGEDCGKPCVCQNWKMETDIYDFKEETISFVYDIYWHYEAFYSVLPTIDNPPTPSSKKCTAKVLVKATWKGKEQLGDCLAKKGE